MTDDVRASNPQVEIERLSSENAKLRGRMHELEQHVESLADRVNELEGQAFEPPSVGSKKGMVKTTAKYRSLDAAKSGQNGGALRYRETKDVTEAMFDTTISPQTVYDAWGELADEYDCYAVEKGADGSEQLRITRDGIPETLRNEVEMFRREHLSK